MKYPKSTYRLQFNKNFKFEDLKVYLDYFEKLGISGIYASPVFKAQPGSSHGYDGVNPHLINTEIGDEEEFAQLSKLLKEKNMLWIQDIVPNHMAYSPYNSWITDVFEKGPASGFYHFFDIDWNHPEQELNGKLMLPFFGDKPENLFDNGELKIKLKNTGFILQYHENEYNLNIASYNIIPEEISHVTEKPVPAKLETLTNQILNFKNSLFEEKEDDQWERLKTEYYKLYNDDAEIKHFFDEGLDILKQNKEVFFKILDCQYFKPVYWRETENHINYRRFFTVNDLICLNMDHDKVFRYYHRYIANLVKKGFINGLRIDHIDGLYNPEKYLSALKKLIGKEFYILVEKILEKDEQIPDSWGCNGTTGYDFMAMVNNLFTLEDNEKPFAKLYKKITGNKKSFNEVFYEKKHFILYHRMNGELNNLFRYLKDTGIIPVFEVEELGEERLREALGEMLINCPVYKIYGRVLPLKDEEQKVLDDTFVKAEQNAPHLSTPLHRLWYMFSKEPLDDHSETEKITHFFHRCMQFTGPLMAKGIEDTALYNYNFFVAHNEVGDSPSYFGITKKEFHEKMEERQKNAPYAMNATSTHDTKRGEDARARLNVLSDLAEEWSALVIDWQRMNKKVKSSSDKYSEIPDRNDEYFIYQALLGSYPVDHEKDGDFKQRFKDYLIKALREAKVYTSWAEPDEEYENGTLAFVDALLNENGYFWQNFEPFFKRITHYGVINSLTQTLLKFTCPGVPDIYQGSELWNFSMVDPDNRRAVDFKCRNNYLDELIKELHTNNKEELIKKLWYNFSDGKIKLLLNYICLHERKENPDVFAHGRYIPLKVKGELKKHVFAFARNLNNCWYIVVIPLHIAAIKESDKSLFENIDWDNTRIKLPQLAPENWQNLITSKNLNRKGNGNIYISDLFNDIPVGLLKAEKEESKRAAGVLLHISSLPSDYGIGDLGPEAYKFADFLEKSGQTYWQMLPLNPVEKKSYYSPYSSYSAFAGNPLLISPDLMIKEGLLDYNDTHFRKFSDKGQVNFEEVEKFKNLLFEIAIDNFENTENHHLAEDVELFQKAQDYWLEDFALYSALKKHFSGQDWNDWPRELQERDQQGLEKYRERLAYEIKKEKFIQFLFFKQWHDLKKYCNDRNISLFGDLPIYVNHNSADVWANQQYFKLDQNKEPKAKAGVPPDYFSSEGQLWGMPVFNWNKLKEDGYEWWVNRIYKNLTDFDRIRLDHFRAFSAYWEVPAGEKTAINGRWVKGPGEDFFNTLKDKFDYLPIVAEDLGDIDDAVHELREEFDFPGMRVLQFAFGDNMPENIHISHLHVPKSVVYTGTHDNNTIKGWYNNEIDKATRKRISLYLDKKVNYNNINEELIRLAYSSVANIVIVPVQDIIGLGEEAIMNRPSVAEGNWRWKMKKGQLNEDHQKFLKNLVSMFGRY